MNDKVENGISKLLRARKSRRRGGVLLLMLVILAAAVPFYAFRMNAIAKTYQKRVLVCPCESGAVSHIHNDDCYSDGVLVCRLEEIEPHEHDAECFEAVLACGMEENEEHHHDESCYEHVLTCGKPVLPVHYHSAECFEIVEMPAEEVETLAAEEAISETFEDSEVATGSAEAETAQTDEPEATEEPESSALHFEAVAGDVAVVVDADADAFPEGTVMKAEPVYDEAVISSVAGAVPGAVVHVQAVDITFLCDGEEVEPAKPIHVTMTPIETPVVVTEDAAGVEQTVVHVDHEGGATVVEQEESPENEVAFDADSFSIYAIVYTIIEKTITASDGNTYSISVTFGADAELPFDAVLDAREILPSETGEYDEYLRETENALGCEAGSIPYARFFDITILDTEGAKLQPAEGTTVDVKIELADADSGKDLRVLHFADGALPLQSGDGSTGDPAGGGAEIVDCTAEAGKAGQVISFAAGGFSVYAIAEDAYTVPVYENPVTNIVEGVGYLFSNQERYITNTIYTAADPNGLGKTQLRQSASLFYFEKAEGENQYYVYTFTGENGSVKQYICFEYLDSQNGHITLSESRPDTPLTITVSNASKGEYAISGTDSDENGNTGTWYINQFGGTGGARFAGWHQNDNGSKITITQPADLPSDALGLDGKTYGLLNFKSDISGYMMMADAVNNNSRLERKWTLIKEDPLEHSGRLFIAENADAPMWTFHAVGGDIYYLTTEIDGVTKFLNVQASGLSLSDDYDASCNITVTPGTGSYSGKLKLIGSDGSVIRMYENSATNGFGTTTATENANDWMNLTVKSNLTDEDFVSYSAHKVSVSDTENVPDGKQIIVYTRTWNDTKKEYEFYAIDHDGSLVRVYENGTELSWVGTQVNTLLWDFTEYHNNDGTPNYYYELQNAYSGKYLAPQIRNNQALSDSTIGLNLNGRRYEEYATTILAWDDPDYQYSGFKVENGRLTACPLSEAEDFYFAIMEPTTEEVQLTTVATVDNNTFGISMKMIDYNGTKTNNGSYDQTQTAVMGSTGNDKGLVSPYLDADGYPTATKTGKSLSELYNGAYDVNHLFLADTYNESGYFEYNSTENFAHLVLEGDTKWLEAGYQVDDFVVYDQVGTIETSNNSLKHGQFMPYNDLDGTISERWSNQTDETDAVLPYTDPRKDKLLYTIPYNPNKAEGEDNNANYHFGMEMTASFTQTADGLDAWGHDIIFEFAGDDDMFLFVDGVLVLDLGGVHAAQTGKVNFRTGAITGSGVNNNNNTLLKVFTNSYKAQHPDWNQTELNEWLGGIFKKDNKGNLTSVFLDYSTHTMRMLYMERGAGASNLHMRFNLAAVKPGTVQLGKTLSGVEAEDSVNAEFPYQIWYSTRPIEGDEPIWHLLGAETGETDLVKYVGSSRTVKYAASYIVNGVATPYEHVFFLKPDETAEITLPDGALQYKIVECGVNPNIYDQVKVNDAVITGEAITGSTKENYWTSAATLSERNSVTYDNHIRKGAMRTLTFTKRLYDVEGKQIPHDNSDAVFDFRLYLGGENDAELSTANMQAYYVKDENGYYCRWDNNTGTFASIEKTEYTSLTAAEKELVTFHSSINGAISYIPVDYTVEVRQILVGSGYKVVERDYEVPEGYSWKGYELTDRDGTREVRDKSEQNDGIGDIIHENDDPSMIVQNYKGWGITVNKVWSDADFMESHDTIYFAVYTDDGNGNLTLVEGTVRAMPTDSTSLYWYFDRLTNGVDFDHHVIREVTISEADPNLDDNGFVTDPVTVTPIAGGGTLAIHATPIIDHTEASFTYTVGYTQGSLDEDHDNIRTDTVTNSRPGIEIRKTDQSGAPLSGAIFTLKTQETGADVGQVNYTSGEDGLVTIAYLPDGTFVLTETLSPVGYSGISQPLTITKSGGTVTLSGPDDSEYTYTEPTAENPNAVIIVKDRPFYLKAIKENAQNLPLQGVHFALYRQVKATNGQLIKDYYPIEGYEDLVTDEYGIIPQITSALGHGTYYLVETQALEEYQPLDTDICFTISDTGAVTIVEGADRSLSREQNVDDGTVSYTITVTNATAWKKLQFKKVDIAKPHQSSLADAHFDLYAVINGVRQENPLYQNLVSGSDGILAFEKTTEDESGQPVTETVTVFELPVGVYHLIETQAPAGYNSKTDPVVITITSTKVSYDEGTVLSQSGSGISYDTEKRLYTLLLSNSSGYELPTTGGVGTDLITSVGALTTALAGVALFLRKRRKS